MCNLKKEIYLFLLLLLLLSGTVYFFIFRSTIDNLEDSFLVLILVYCPFIAAITTRLITEGNIRKLGWKFGKGKYLIIAFSIPVIYGIIVYGFAWATQIGVLNKDFKLGLGSDLPKGLDIFLFIIIGVLARAIGAFGEEVGWRGFLTPRLYKLLGFKATSIVVGLIWIIWHIPLMIMTDYGGGFSILKLVFFTVALISVCFMLTWLRIKSSSLWVGVLCHASHNFFIQNVFDKLLIQKSYIPFLTEMGLGICITSVGIALIFLTFRNRITQNQDYIIK